MEMKKSAHNSAVMDYGIKTETAALIFNIPNSSFSVSDTGKLGKRKSEFSLEELYPYDLPITSSDALPLS